MTACVQRLCRICRYPVSCEKDFSFGCFVGANVAMSVKRFVTLSRAGDPVTALQTLIRLGETPYVDAMLRVVRQKPVIR